MASNPTHWYPPAAGHLHKSILVKGVNGGIIARDVTGIDLPVPREALSKLRPHLRDIRFFEADALSLSDLPVIQELLMASLPRLEFLTITVRRDSYDGPELPPTTQRMTTLDLRLGQFPALEKIRLRNVIALLSSSVLSRLRHLSFESDADLSRPHHLPAFLDDRILPPYSAPHLHFIAITAEPTLVSWMLSSLSTPANAHLEIQLHGLDNLSPDQFYAACMSAFPRNGRCLPVLKRINRLCVHRGSNYSISSPAYLQGDTIPADGGYVELRCTTEEPHGAYSGRGGLFYEKMVLLARGLMPGAPLQAMDFIGELDAVALSTWVAVLQHFQAVQRLHFDWPDIRYTMQRAHPQAAGVPFAETVTSILTARPLVGPGVPAPPVVCPHLTTLKIEAGVKGPDTLQRILQCLEWRRARGAAPVLERFRLELTCDPNPWTAQDVARFRQALSRFACQCTFEVVRAHDTAEDESEAI